MPVSVETIREVMRELGKRKSERKTTACRLNAKHPRKRKKTDILRSKTNFSAQVVSTLYTRSYVSAQILFEHSELFASLISMNTKQEVKIRFESVSGKSLSQRFNTLVRYYRKLATHNSPEWIANEFKRSLINNIQRGEIIVETNDGKTWSNISL